MAQRLGYIMRTFVVRLSEKQCQLDLIVLHALPAGQTPETKNQASLWWEHTLQELLALDLLPFSLLCVDELATRRVRWKMSMEQVCVFWWRPCTCRSHKQKYSNKTIEPGSLRKESNIALPFLGISEAVQLQIHACAPTDAFLFGSGHFQDHRAVVIEFSTVATTSLQVTHDYRPAICDRQLPVQESVQCLLQHGGKQHPCYRQPDPEPR